MRPLRFYHAWVFVAAALFIALLGSGCQTVRAKLKNGTLAQGPADPGTPATVSAGSTVTTVPLPQGSQVESIAPMPATASIPASPASVKATLAGASEMRVESSTETATTGTVDTTVAVKRIEIAQASADRAPLLWAALGLGVAGVLALALLKEWPMVGRSLLTAAALAGAAWKVAEIPWWAFAAVLVLGGVAVAFYKRAEWDADGDGVPDVLQKRKPAISP